MSKQNKYHPITPSNPDIAENFPHNQESHLYNTKPEEKIDVENIIATNEAANDFKLLKILIAEDDEVSSLFITIALKKISREVLYAETGVEAIELCRNNPDIDLVLMDIKMPVLNGYEAAMQIRNFNKEVIIFAQTSYALSGDREKAIMAGCNDYISKPILDDKLQTLIQKYFK
ncbi:MAG: response regulator [Bacteroidota bacterium]